MALTSNFNGLWQASFIKVGFEHALRASKTSLTAGQGSILTAAPQINKTQ